MNKPIEASSSWTGLLAILAALAFLVVAVWAGVRYVSASIGQTEKRIGTEFLEPYVAALQRRDARHVWSALVTESYRKRHAYADYARTLNKVMSIYGTPKEARIAFAVSTYEPGRSFQAVQVEFVWDRGGRFTRTLQLVDVPGAGYRLDGATLGGRNVRVVPQDIPANPW
ncbi:MAG: hypothetical protein AB7F96_03200 [Beijerinckiaceae bacterium]